MKKKILHIIDSLGIGGAEILLRDTLPLLKDYENIVCYLHAPDTLLPEFKNYTVYHLNYSSWVSFFHVVSRLRRIIRQHNVSIVHTHLFYSTLFARFACPRNVKFIFTIHSILSKDAFEVNRISLWIEKLTYKKKQNLIGVSKAVLDDYEKWVGIKGKSFVLYNYIKESFFHLEPNRELNVLHDFRLVAVGNLKRAKNYSKLLEAFSLLKEQSISLDIFGSGDLKGELQKRIESEQMKVHLMGQTDDPSKIFPNYHAYIMPSLYEGFGIAPLEAMATGMPALLSNLAVFREVAEDIPVYFDPNNAGSIAMAIQDTLLNWRHVSLNAVKGKELIQRKVSKEIYLNKLLEIYLS